MDVALGGVLLPAAVVGLAIVAVLVFFARRR